MTTPSRTSSTPTSRLARTTLADLALATAATCTGVAVSAAPAEARPDQRPTRIDPDRLERGGDTSVAHVEGRRIVEGDTVTKVEGDFFTLLGTRPDGDYVVLVGREGDLSVRAFTPGGGGRVLLPGSIKTEYVLGGDGTTLVAATFKNRPRRHTTLRVYDSTTGELLGSQKGRGALSPLDADGATVVYSGEDGPVVSWDLASDATTRVTGRYGYRADLGQDLLATFTDDPFDGGCTVVSTLSEPGDELWRSCQEAVAAFAPDGSHVLTTHLLADGIGPTDVWLRTLDGDLGGHYRVDGFFGELLFEDADTVLLEAVTSDARGLARCDAGACELAGDLRQGEPWL